MDNIITVENLCKNYVTYKRGSGFRDSVKSFFKRERVDVKAVDSVSFTVAEGDVVGILGPNGAGKSTTIKMLTGTLYPTSGSMRVMGYDPCRQRSQYVEHIGAVFGQKSQLVFDIPPIDSFALNKAIYGIDSKSYKRRLDRLVELLELGDKLSRPTRVLSLGERMKCEFIMAMLHEPRIVFLDEPTIGLDVISKKNIRSFIREMNAAGTTFVLTTHDLDDVEQLVRDVIIINNGAKVFDDTIEQLRHTLGNKKIVEATFDDASVLPPLEWTGARMLSVDEHHVVFELDADILPATRFIGELSSVAPFTDISIRELPMEDVITAIYKG